MIYSSQIPHMNLIIIFMLITLQCTQNLVVEAALNAAEYLNVHALQELHFMEDNGDLKDNHVEKVSGEDENEKKEVLILEKFRALLGLKSFKTSPSPSPLPSPLPTIESEAPAPAPMVPIHAHSHHPFHHSHHIPPHHKIHREDRDQGRVRRIIISVLVSAGAIFIMCAIGLMCICRKFSEERKKSKGTVSIYSTEAVPTSRSKFVSPQSSSKKVSSDSDLDLFHLDSALEPKALHTSPNQKTPKSILHEREEFDKEPTKSESDNVSHSVAGEIRSVHGSAESIRCESDKSSSSSGDNIVYFEAHSSDDVDSFHSFNDSHSSSVRLSSASLGSPSDKPKTISPYVSKVSSSVTSPMNFAIPSPIPRNSEQNMQAAPSSSNCQIGFRPPPPPPPPPPPCVHVSPYGGASCSMRITSKPLSSSTLPKLPSPRNSDSSSGSNITLKRDLPLSLSNPPKSQVGIPPPPCPPPFFKGNGKHLKGPPPPPPQLPQYVPLGKDGAPLPKLKPLHWDKVRAASNRSTVWDKLRSSSFEFDEEMIESLFGYNLQDSMKNDEGKSKSPSPSKHVLDPKRLQNITILSKALNATAEQVCEALIKGDGLCLQQLEVLVKMVPTKEEEALLFGYKGNINELGSAERYVKAMLNIPFAFLRIEAMLYHETFEDEVVHLRKSFSMLEEACKELRSSRLFLKLLEAVLKTGNRMNVGTIRGGARAFKLDALLKLADVKGTDGKTTLLHFVVQEIVRSEGIRTSESIMGKINQKNKSKNVEEREEHYRRMGLDLVSGLSTELCNVKKTATIDLDVLAISVSNLSDGMAKLKHLVNKNLCVDEKSGGFVHSMRSFLGYAEKNIMELKEDEDNVLLLVRKITEYFHGDVSKDEANPLRIFVIVRDFLGMLDHVCKELRSLKVPSSPSPLAPFR